MFGGFGIIGVNYGTHSTPFYVSEYFRGIEMLLRTNSQEIITLHVESYVSNQEIKLALQDSGLGGYLLTNNPNSRDLTLGKMREQGHRLVILTDKTDQEKGIFSPFFILPRTF